MLKSSQMNTRSTTPVPTSLAKKATLVAAAVLMMAAAPISIARTVMADQFDSQISSLQSQINEYQAQANKMAGKARTLEQQLGRLTSEKNAITAQVKLSQAEYDKLQKQIEDTQKEIDDNKDALGKIIADMYLDNNVSPLEMLASSSNIGDYVDKQAYRDTIRSTLSDTIDRITKLKQKLEADKAKVEEVLKRQKSQEASLAAKEAERAKLVAQTRGQEAAFQHLVSQNQSRLESVAAQQRAYYASLQASGNGGNAGVVGSFSYSNWSGNMGCSGGYPYCGAQDTSVDPWGLYNRECVSYVAWALSARFGKYVGNFSGSGNAGQWPWSAPAYSGATRVSSPQRGDAVILPATPGFAPIGHAMIVESVSGGTVHVSQYNFYGTGEYSTMDIGTGGVVFLRFPSK